MTTLIDAVSSLAGQGVADTIFGAKPNIPTQPLRAGMILSLGSTQNKDEPFFFYELEIPVELPGGRYQMAAEHQFIGGGKAVDLFGSQSKPTQFSGKLFNLPFIPAKDYMGRDRHEPGATAVGRLQRLLDMLDAGEKMVFQFHEIKYTCAIVNVEYNILHWNEVDYTIYVNVLDDNLNENLPSTSPKLTLKLNPLPQVGLLQAFTEMALAMDKFLTKATAIMNMATAIVNIAKTDPGALLMLGVAMVPGSSAVVDLITKGDKAYAAMGRLRDTVWPQTYTDYSNAQPYETLDNSVHEKILRPNLSAMRDELKQVRDFFCEDFAKLSPEPTKAAFKLDLSLIAAVLSMLSAVYAKLDKMDKLSQKIIKPRRYAKKVYSNTTLFNIALERYGDATKWTVLRDANGLSSPYITTPIQLICPYEDQLADRTPSLNPSINSGT